MLPYCLMNNFSLTQLCRIASEAYIWPVHGLGKYYWSRTGGVITLKQAGHNDNISTVYGLSGLCTLIIQGEYPLAIKTTS